MGHKLKQNKVVNSRTDFFYYMFRNILLFGAPLLIISGLVLSHLSLHSSATGASINDSSHSGTDHVFFSLDTSCTMDGELVSAHTTELHGGQYKEDIGTTKLSAYCNDNNGYSIYAIGSSNNTDGNTDLINNVSDNYNIHTGIYNSGSNTSSWSMKLTPGIGTGIDPDTGESVNLTPPTIRNNYNNYNIIPNTYTLVASRTSGTSMTADVDATGSYLTTTYAIYASSIQPPGNYDGNVKYVMVHPSSNINTVPDIDTAFAVNGKMKVYEEGGNSYYAMQDMDSQICNFVSGTGASTATQLVDTRDNNLYWVAKLDDGKCWMTENLDLDIGGTNTQPLNSNNTDISTTASGSGIYTNGYSQNNGVWTWNPVSTAITHNYTISGTSVSPSWSTDNYTIPYSLEGGGVYIYSSGSTSNDPKYTSLSNCATGERTEAECKRYSTGNFYSWTAAIASNNSTNIGNTPEEIATNSICPKGWRLPNASQTDNVNNEFGRMLYKAGITASLSNGGGSVGYLDGTTSFNKLRSDPYYLVRSGYIYGGTLFNSSIYSLYWSSSARNSSYAYSLRLNSSSINPANNDNRYFGGTIRCVAR